MRPATLTTTRANAGMLQGRNGGLEAGIIGAVDTVVTDIEQVKNEKKSFTFR